MSNPQNHLQESDLPSGDIGQQTMSGADIAAEINDLQVALDDMLARVEVFLGQ